MIEFVSSQDNDSDIFTKNTTSEIHHRHSEKLIWTKEEYEIEASRITTGRVLRGIVNQSHSNGKSQSNSDRNMIKEMSNDTSYGKAIRNTKDNMLRDTNRYEVLENYDDLEHAKTGTKSTTLVNWEGKSIEINLLKTVKQPLCELSNMLPVLKMGSTYKIILIVMIVLFRVCINENIIYISTQRKA